MAKKYFPGKNPQKKNFYDVKILFEKFKKIKIEQIQFKARYVTAKNNI